MDSCPVHRTMPSLCRVESGEGYASLKDSKLESNVRPVNVIVKALLSRVAGALPSTLVMIFLSFLLTSDRLP